MPGEPRRAPWFALPLLGWIVLVQAACAPLPRSVDGAPERAMARGQDAEGAQRAQGAAHAWQAPPLDPALAARAYAGARTYAGTLECAACTPTRLTITVLADGTYRLREAPTEASDGGSTSGPAFVEFGRWHVSAEAADRLVLQSSEGLRVLRRVAPDGLALLDHEGREIRGLRDATLARVPGVDPLRGPLRLSGIYVHEGRRSYLTECATGRRLLLQADAERRSGSLAALEFAIGQLQPGKAESVLATVRGYLAPLEESGAIAQALVVSGFERASRNAACPRAPQGPS